MMYNLTEAKKQFIRTGAYLATSMGWNDEAPPTEKQVERWRESAMTLLNQQKAAHKEISTMQAEIDELKYDANKQREYYEAEIDELKKLLFESTRVVKLNKSVLKNPTALLNWHTATANYFREKHKQE